jgi:hypothetical protein
VGAVCLSTFVVACGNESATNPTPTPSAACSAFKTWRLADENLSVLRRGDTGRCGRLQTLWTRVDRVVVRRASGHAEPAYGAYFRCARFREDLSFACPRLDTFCIVSVMVGMAAASNSLGGELSGAAAIGVGIGLGFWAFVWFVPVVGLEVVVLTATVTAKQVPADHGTSKREWQRAFLFCAAPNLLLLLAIFASIGSSTSSSPTKRSGHDASRSGQSEVVGITMDKFTQLRDGMSYSEVVAILGQSGKELSRSSIAGTTTVMYSWEGWGIANMNAMFQDDRMISKAQFGLR